MSLDTFKEMEKPKARAEKKREPITRCGNCDLETKRRECKLINNAERISKIRTENQLMD